MFLINITVRLLVLKHYSNNIIRDLFIIFDEKERIVAEHVDISNYLGWRKGQITRNFYEY